MFTIDQGTTRVLFALLRSAICGTELTEGERGTFSEDMLRDLLNVSSKHDLSHLLVLGLKQNKLIPKENAAMEKHILTAVYRYERLRYEYDSLCNALEKAQIPFLPLKGSVLRDYYPEPWMRTSCDIDILVHQEDLACAIECLSTTLGYEIRGKGTHDISLYTPKGIHIELHFDLIEENCANNAFGVLQNAWKNVSLRQNRKYHYEMTDAFFYFHHIAHMAQHFETGGCGIRPFLDLWILDRMENSNFTARTALLSEGGLLKFAQSVRKLSRFWLDGEEPDEVSAQMQDYLFRGGVYGTSKNRVTLLQKKRGGRLGYLRSRIFIPYEKLKRYYPILEEHRWLMPIMHTRRWLKLLTPHIAAMAKSEIKVNRNLQKEVADQMDAFLTNIGL